MAQAMSGSLVVGPYAPIRIIVAIYAKWLVAQNQNTMIFFSSSNKSKKQCITNVSFSCVLALCMDHFLDPDPANGKPFKCIQIISKLTLQL